MKKYLLLLIVVFLHISVVFSPSQELKIGDIAPDIRLPNLNGDTVSLYSMRGKIVLIDFWATWCAPCVKEQAKLGELYNKYKDSVFTIGKGFDIFGVSLDNKKKAWQSVIKKYKINWTQVSDLKYWASPAAATYNLQELPFNILINGKGEMIDKNLHGEELENVIRKILIQDNE